MAADRSAENGTTTTAVTSASTRTPVIAAVIAGLSAAAGAAVVAPPVPPGSDAIVGMTAVERDRLLENAEHFAELPASTRAELRRVAAAVAADPSLAGTLERYRAFVTGLPLYRSTQLRRAEGIDEKLAVVREIAAAAGEEPEDVAEPPFRDYLRDDRNYAAVTDAIAGVLPFDAGERDTLATTQLPVRAVWVFGRLASVSSRAGDRGLAWLVPQMVRRLEGSRAELLAALPDDRPRHPRGPRSEVPLTLLAFILETESRWDSWRLAGSDEAELAAEFAATEPADVADLIALPEDEFRLAVARAAAEDRLGAVPVPPDDLEAARRVLASSTNFRRWLASVSRGRDGASGRSRGGRSWADLFDRLRPPPPGDEDAPPRPFRDGRPPRDPGRR